MSAGLPSLATRAADIDRRPWVVMFSASPWHAAAHRQHALARELARDVDDGYRVLFVDPPSNRASARFAVRSIGPSLWQATVPSPLPFGRQLPVANSLGRWRAVRLLRRWLDDRPGARVLWIDEDLAAPVIGSLGEAAVVYDATDLDWTFTRSWNRSSLRLAMGRAVAAADLVLTSSSALPPRLPPSRSPAVVVANACDPDDFQPAGATLPWLDRLPRPILGYIGALDTRAFDGALVAAVASAHPEWTFALVGPSTRAGTAALQGLANVYCFAAVPFADAPAVLRSFDVGIIPYRVGGLIDYVHPKKCFEYLATGKPVVATPLPALVALGAPIQIAAGQADFSAAIADALTALEDAGASAARAERRAVANNNSWAVRGTQVRGLLAELLGKRPSATARSGRAA